MSRTVDPDKRQEYESEREEWIRWFLTHPEGLVGDRPHILKEQHYIQGKTLWTKPPHQATKGRDKAIIAQWQEGKLHLYNPTSALGKQTRKLAKELGIEIQNDSTN